MDQDQKIEAYLAGIMEEDERQKFEAELSADPALRHEVERFRQLNEGLKTYGKAGLRAQLQEIANQENPIEPPHLNFSDKIQYYLKAHRLLLFAVVGLLFLTTAGLITFKQNGCPDESLALQYFQRPVLVHEVAGASDEVMLSQKASRFYSGALLDSLQYLADQQDFIVARYYLAHLHHKNRDFKQAIQEYEILIANKPALQAYGAYQDIGRLKFNQLLSNWALTLNIEESKSQLKLLKNDPDAKGSAVRESIDQFEEGLNRALLPFLCF